MRIYVATCRINWKQYIGQTTATLNVRWNRHQHDARNGSKLPLHRAMRKYGVENFIIEEIVTADDLDQLNAMEVEAIKIFHTLVPYGYNLSSGGKNSLSHIETKAKLSAMRKGKSPPNKGKKASEETKAKMSAALKGRHFSDEHKAKLSAALIGKEVADSTKEKMRANNLGKKASLETKAKMSAARIGNQYSKGYKHSPETLAKRGKLSSTHKANIAKSNKGRVVLPETRIKISEANKRSWRVRKGLPE